MFKLFTIHMVTNKILLTLIGTALFFASCKKEFEPDLAILTFDIITPTNNNNYHTHDTVIIAGSITANKLIQSIHCEVSGTAYNGAFIGELNLTPNSQNLVLDTFFLISNSGGNSNFDLQINAITSNGQQHQFKRSITVAPLPRIIKNTFVVTVADSLYYKLYATNGTQLTPIGIFTGDFLGMTLMQGDSGILVTSSGTSGNLHLINTSTLQLIRSVPNPHYPLKSFNALAIYGSKLYLSGHQGFVYTLDLLQNGALLPINDLFGLIPKYLVPISNNCYAVACYNQGNAQIQLLHYCTDDLQGLLTLNGFPTYCQFNGTAANGFAMVNLPNNNAEIISFDLLQQTQGTSATFSNKRWIAGCKTANNEHIVLSNNAAYQMSAPFNTITLYKLGYFGHQIIANELNNEFIIAKDNRIDYYDINLNLLQNITAADSVAQVLIEYNY
ncbi:MAG: hypothetical protein RIQ89_1767 [Bacteroidota bacterium]